MNENNKDTNQVEKERITDSPNISVNPDDLNELQETISVSSENLEIAKPTTEQQTKMKFRSADISHLDGKNLMVNVEGSQKRKIEEAKQKKKDQQEAEKRKKTEERKRKHDAHIIKRNKRINNLRTIAQKIWKLKFVFLGVILAIVAIVLTVKVIIPFAGKIETETKKAAEEKIVTENKTTMIEVYKELTGKTFTKEELEEIVNSKNSGLTVIYAGESGNISVIEGDTESIKFSISQDGQDTISNFYYFNYVDDIEVMIFGSGSNYHYNYGEELKNFSSADEAINEYILDMHKAGREI
ncbi:hypothetical protein IJV57_04860 [Candidatus Saccharibacteria bacterium]|nr:hypothetical protein [Candidatus Saccharibacteria bacterium]